MADTSQNPQTQEDADTSSMQQSGQAGAATGDPVQDVAALMEELEKLRQMAARAQADLQNAKQRMEREAADARRYATESVVLRLLPTIENLQRAVEHVPASLQSDEWAKGVMMLEQECMRQLEDVGLKRMKSVGQTIDPQYHEVLQLVPGPEGVVVSVFEEGYTLHDRVLRAAKVTAGNGQGGSGGAGGEQDGQDTETVE